ncbi:MAG: glutamate synthase-related protein [Lachnospiraceae bacterium]
MAVFICSVCGTKYDESERGVLLSELEKCPVCGQSIENFQQMQAPQAEASQKQVEPLEKPETVDMLSDLAYDSRYSREDSAIRYMKEIHEMAVTGESVYAAMNPMLPMPSWDEILLLGAQLNPMPLEKDAPINLTTVIGKNAKRPMILGGPIYISHMSFGALSREAKIALAQGSAKARTAMCSGEGGILQDEMDASYKYIFEYVPNMYSVSDENLRNSDAIEIKIGQSSKPGMGGHLPASKVTEEIAAIRNRPVGQDITSPSRLPGVDTKEDLKALVETLRRRSDGRPIGIKIAAGRIERDLDYCIFAEPDFITIDGRGGATGSSPWLLRDATSVPTIFALYRARKYLDDRRSEISLVITGGLRVSSDFAKALAMGADAVAIATAGLIAIACQQYRICGTGNCPAGVATQDPELRKRLNVTTAAKRLENYLTCTFDELKNYCRITGHPNIHELRVTDLCTISREISDHTNIPHA